MSLEKCKQECDSRPDCKGISYFNQKCRLNKAICTNPKINKGFNFLRKEQCRDKLRLKDISLDK